MTSAYAALSQVRAALVSLPDVPHHELCRSYMQLFKEQQAAAVEIERIARFHPLRVTKDVLLTSFSTLSILSLLVFGRNAADLYANVQQQIASIDVPLPALQEKMSDLLPTLPYMEHAARLPEITLAQAVLVTLVVAVLVLLLRVFQSIRSYTRNRLIQQGITNVAQVIPVLESAAETDNRNQAIIQISHDMQKIAHLEAK